jgi:malate/lactate dehydrogenase
MYNSKGLHNYANIPNDIVISLPRKCMKQGTVEVVNDLSLDDEISQLMIQNTVEELVTERQHIEHLLI